MRSPSDRIRRTPAERSLATRPIPSPNTPAVNLGAACPIRRSRTNPDAPHHRCGTNPGDPPPATAPRQVHPIRATRRSRTQMPQARPEPTCPPNEPKRTPSVHSCSYSQGASHPQAITNPARPRQVHERTQHREASCHITTYAPSETSRHSAINSIGWRAISPSRSLTWLRHEKPGVSRVALGSAWAAGRRTRRARASLTS